MFIFTKVYLQIHSKSSKTFWRTNRKCKIKVLIAFFIKRLYYISILYRKCTFTFWMQICQCVNVNIFVCTCTDIRTYLNNSYTHACESLTLGLNYTSRKPEQPLGDTPDARTQLPRPLFQTAASTQVGCHNKSYICKQITYKSIQNKRKKERSEARNFLCGHIASNLHCHFHLHLHLYLNLYLYIRLQCHAPPDKFHPDKLTLSLRLSSFWGRLLSKSHVGCRCRHLPNLKVKCQKRFGKRRASAL